MSKLYHIGQILILLLLFLMPSMRVHGQYPAGAKRKIDSLENVLLGSPPDTLKAKIYMEIGELYGVSKADTVITLNEKAMAILIRAMKEYQPGSREYNSLNILKATVFNNTGMCYKAIGNIEMALNNLHLALLLDEEHGDKMRIAITLTNLAAIYQLQDNFDQAIEYFKKAIESQEAAGDSTNLGDGYWNLGNTYMSVHDSVNYFVMMEKSAEAYVRNS